MLNLNQKKRVQISKILKITAGGFHCWCDSNVGIIKKPNNAIADYLWDTFLGKLPTIKAGTIEAKEIKVDLSKPLPNIPLFPDELKEISAKPKPNLWRRICNWIAGFFARK